MPNPDSHADSARTTAPAPTPGGAPRAAALVKDWMTSPARAVRPETTFLAAYAQMRDAHIHRMPVVDQEKLVGVVTLTDIQQIHPALTVQQIMTPPPLVVTPETTIAHAASIMLGCKIDGLPVVDHTGRLVGVITQTDLVRVLIQQEIPEEAR